jgi:hypothetical protein
MNAKKLTAISVVVVLNLFVGAWLDRLWFRPSVVVAPSPVLGLPTESKEAPDSSAQPSSVSTIALRSKSKMDMPDMALSMLPRIFEQRPSRC